MKVKVILFLAALSANAAVLPQSSSKSSLSTISQHGAIPSPTIPSVTLISSAAITGAAASMLQMMVQIMSQMAVPIPRQTGNQLQAVSSFAPAVYSSIIAAQTASVRPTIASPGGSVSSAVVPPAVASALQNLKPNSLSSSSATPTNLVKTFALPSTARISTSTSRSTPVSSIAFNLIGNPFALRPPSTSASASYTSKSLSTSRPLSTSKSLSTK